MEGVRKIATEKQIWDFLLEKIGNPYGVAGLMGNLYAESGLNPKNLQNTYNKKLGMTDDEYTDAVDNGSYTNFVNDSAGYGLAQWTYHSRKQNLLNYAKKNEASIGNLEMQLGFLWEEIQKYTAVISVLMGASNVSEASDVVLLKYEKPKNQGDSVKMARSSYGQKYYDLYNTPTPSETNDEKEDAEMSYDPQKVIKIAEGEIGYLEKKDKNNLDDKTANAEPTTIPSMREIWTRLAFITERRMVLRGATYS